MSQTRFNKVLLVNPAYSRSYFSIPVLPAGLGYLAESLKRNGIQYEVFDMSLGYDFEDLRKKVKTVQPNIVGMSCISYMLKNNFGMLSQLKKEFPSVKIAVGGPHVSSVKDNVLKEHCAVDYAFVGEGENSFIELCKGVSPAEIKGLVFRDGDDVVYAGPRDFISNLDSLGFPHFDGFELERYGFRMISTVTSRGCPYSCIYCSCNVIGKKIRFRSPESILEEIGYWYARGYREFGIQEDNPTFDKNRMLKFCEGIQRSGFRGLMFQCGNGVRADRVDRELLIEMKKAGFKRLAFGIESGSDKVLRAIKKGATVEIMDRAIKLSSELGFFVSIFFLIGSPQETVDDVEKSIQLAQKYRVQDATFFNLIPIPGSELYAYVEKNGYFVRSPNEYLNNKFHPARSSDPVFETPEFSRVERRHMLIKTRRISRRVRRQVLEKKFPKLGRFGTALFWLYCTPIVSRIENRLLCNEAFRNTIGELRMIIRNKVYA